jgi:hypothetical protein
VCSTHACTLTYMSAGSLLRGVAVRGCFVPAHSHALSFSAYLTSMPWKCTVGCKGSELYSSAAQNGHHT